MNPTIRNIIAFIVALAIGMTVNMAIITISPQIIPPPVGADLTTPEGLKAAMPLMEARHFLMPFLAHALGAFVGAFIVALLAASHKMKLAITIGIINLIGGITMVFMLPSPVWFTVIDLTLAYLPVAWIAGKLGVNLSKKNT